MPEVVDVSDSPPTTKLDDHTKAFLEKYSWETYPSKHLKYLEIPAFDLETSLATDQVIHMTDQNVSDADCACLAKALKAMRPVNMKQIYLSNNDIGDDGCIAVCEAAKEMPTFDLFYVANNKIGDAGVAGIAQHLAKTNVWQLVLTENKFGDAGVKALAESGADPAAWPALRWLFLDSSEVGDKGVEALAKACVTGFQAVERLALHDCKLTNKGLGHLARAIGAGALPKCEYLYVQNNDFDVDGKQLLRAAAKARGKHLKVHFGWPPPLPGVDYH